MADEPQDPHQEEVLGKAYDARLMRRLVGYVRPYRGQMAVAVVLVVLSSILELVGPLATAVALDLFVRPLGGGPLTGVSRWVAGVLARNGHPARRRLRGSPGAVASFLSRCC